jgi:hypothetical protein
VDPLPAQDLADLADKQLRALVESLERRRPPAKVASVGVRPDRRPWTYRDIWQLEAAQAELARRGLEPVHDLAGSVGPG